MTQPKPLSEVGKTFLKNLGEGAYRGMILKLYRSQIKKIVGTEDFAAYITGEDLKDRTLVIYCKHPWKHELSARSYQIKKTINDRIDHDYLEGVRIK